MALALAFAANLALSAPPAPVPEQAPFPAVVLAKPIEVSAKLLTGGTISGTLQRWDASALHGSFGTRNWDELAARDLGRIFRQVMDAANCAHWLTLGQLLAASPDGSSLAEEVFTRARSCGASKDEIADARARAAVAVQKRQERQKLDSARRLQDTKKDGARRGAEANPELSAPWPELSAEDRAAALAEVRTFARKVLDAAGIHGTLQETERFVVASDLPPEQLKQVAADLEGCLSRAMGVLGLRAESNPFWGKALVVACATEEEFTLAEAAAFNAKVGKGEQGALHAEGPRVSICAWRGTHERAFNTALMRHMILGLLHRTGSATPLPEWAAEGFALWAARIPEPASHVDQQWRAAGLQFMRRGGNVAQVMGWSTAAGTWPGPNGVGESVGYLLVDLLIGGSPGKFGPWVQAVKRGTPWAQALKDVYGTDPARLAASAATWYSTNDGAPGR